MLFALPGATKHRCTCCAAARLKPPSLPVVLPSLGRAAGEVRPSAAQGQGDVPVNEVPTFFFLSHGGAGTTRKHNATLPCSHTSRLFRTFPRGILFLQLLLYMFAPVVQTHLSRRKLAPTGPGQSDQLEEGDEKIRKHYSSYGRNRVVVFLPVCTSTSGSCRSARLRRGAALRRILRLTFLIANKHADDYFKTLGPCSWRWEQGNHGTRQCKGDQRRNGP